MPKIPSKALALLGVVLTSASAYADNVVVKTFTRGAGPGEVGIGGQGQRYSRLGSAGPGRWH
jgi:hypothetical protein